MPYITNKQLAKLKEISRYEKATINGNEIDLDAVIKSRTLLWRQTWIINPLNDIIKNLEKKSHVKKPKS